MAPAYKNVNSGQVVVSDEPRPDLEELARWEEIPEPVDVAKSADANGTADTGQAEGDKTPPTVEQSEQPPVQEPGAPEVTLPSEDWTHEQIDEHAKAHGIDLPSTAKTKADKIAFIAAHNTAQQGE